MSKSATLALKITGDAAGAKRALDEVDGHTGSFMSSMGKVGGAIAGAFAVGAVVDFGKAVFGAASDLQQSTGAINAVFGDWALDIEQNAQKAAQGVGLSTSAYEQLASVLGAQLKGAGMPIADVTAKTQDLISMGADLAATFGGTTADAVDALSSVLKGETDPIEKYGVSIKQSDINARLAAQGQDKLTGSALKTATAQAALALVTEQTAAAHGQFAQESGTAEGAAQRLSAWWDNLKAKIGGGLLPIFSTLVGFFQDNLAPALDKIFAAGGPVAEFFTSLWGTLVNQVIPSITSLWNEIGPKLLPLLSDVGSFLMGTLVPAFQGLWGYVSQYVIPIFKGVLGPVIDGVRTAFGFIAQKIEENRSKFTGLFEAVKPVFEFLRDKVAPFIGGALKVGFEVLGKAIGVVVDVIGWIVDKIKWLIEQGTKVANFIGGLFGSGDSGSRGGSSTRGAGLYGAARGAGPRLLTAGAGSLTGGAVGPGAAGAGLTPAGDTYYITVTGALDPVAVADQLAGLLDRRAKRLGLTVAGARP